MHVTWQHGAHSGTLSWDPHHRSQGRQERSPLTHFTDKSIESQRWWTSCPRSHRLLLEGWALIPPRLGALLITGQAEESHCSASCIEFGKIFCIHTHTHTHVCFFPGFSFLSLWAGKGHGRLSLTPFYRPHFKKTVGRGCWPCGISGDWEHLYSCPRHLQAGPRPQGLLRSCFTEVLG